MGGKTEKSAASTPLRIVLAVLAGACVGGLLGSRAEPLGELGGLILRAVKALATPLLFFAIVDAFGHVRVPVKQGGRLLFWSTVNACVAFGIAILISEGLELGRTPAAEHLRHALHGLAPTAPSAPSAGELSFGKFITGLVPESVFEPFLKNQVLPLGLLALLLGLALRRGVSLGSEGAQALTSLVRGAFEVCQTLLRWVVAALPVAVFGVIARSVGSSGGVGILLSLGVFGLAVALGLLMQVLVWYSLILRWLGGRGVLAHWRDTAPAWTTALGTGSSLATLPVTLKTLEERLGVRKENARLAACVGTNLNHDGILLYEAVTALFVAQLLGIQLGFAQKIDLALVSVLAAVGIAGVPEAGLVTLSLVLSAVGLPVAIVPLLLPIDWMLGRMRAATNVMSDITVAILLDRKR